MEPITIKNVKIGTGIPKICVPLTGTTKQELEEQAKELHNENVDLAEWRADFFEEVEDNEKVLEVLRSIHKVVPDIPLLFTFRSLHEGGEKEISKETYTDLNQSVIQSKLADLIDIELSRDEETIKEIQTSAKTNHIFTILSSHNFEYTPTKEEIVSSMVRAEKLGADLSKIAVMPKNMQDVLTLLAATVELNQAHLNNPLITMSMGQDGMISRLTGELFGSAVTFGSLHQVSAPGQVPVQDLKQALEMIHRIYR
jgi:3-dehydroquinate dehydratase-1